jgi:hypothetical protein
MVRWKTPPRSEAERRQRAGFSRWLETYWASAQVWWKQAEYETMMYATELAQYRYTNPQPNLKDYMLATAGQPR